MSQTQELIELVNSNHTAIMANMEKAKTWADDIGARVSHVEKQFARFKPNSGSRSPVETLGVKVVASDGYKRFKEELHGQGSVKILVENAITSAPGSGGALVQPDRQADIVALPRIRPMIRDLLAHGETTSNLVEFTRQTGRTNNAATVAEGDLKPESAITFELAEAPVRTIATWIPASRQIMDDAPRLQSFIDSELRFMIDTTEESQVLFGDGTGQNLEGLANNVTAYAPPFAVDAQQNLDVLLLAIAQAQQSRVPATGIVVNDLDWMKMLALKDSTGQYLATGPFGAQPNVAWTLPVVPTPAMPVGHFMVGGFAIAAEIIDRMLTEVLISSEDRDNFIRNMLTIRAESRVALALKIPEALVYGSYDVSSEGA